MTSTKEGVRQTIASEPLTTPELIQSLESLAARAGADAPPLSFLRRYFDTASSDALRARTPEALYALATSHWRLAEQRAPGEIDVRVQPPGEGRGLAWVQTVIEDMPFLVDSVMLCVREAGGVIDWAVHPILYLVRDAEGRLDVPASLAAHQGPAESLIHIEFEPLADAAAYARLEASLRSTLAEVRTAVADYPAMRLRLARLQADLDQPPAAASAAEFDEARAFLDWLDERHFTFLGVAESRVEPAADGRPSLRTLHEAGLGLLRAGARLATSDELIAPQEELDKYAGSARLLVITKANVRSSVHHAEYLDVISVKQFAADGSVAGTVRLIGLFTGDAYAERPSEIPVVRRKVAEVMVRAQLPPDSHSAKNLREILQAWPRDELFQSGEEELFAAAMSVRALRDRHQLRFLMRRDRYGRFYSCLVFVPRERYSRELREQLARELLGLFGGYAVERNVDFLRGGFTRLHFIVRTPPGTRSGHGADEIEARLVAVTRSWRDQLREILQAAGDPEGRLSARFLDAYPLSAQEATTPSEAAADIAVLVGLSASQPLGVRLLLDAHQQVAGLKLYREGGPVALSDALPVLENFGLRVLNQDPVELQPAIGASLWVQSFVLQAQVSGELTPEALRRLFEQAFLVTWRGEAENDGLNRLVLAAGLSARQVTALRTLATYLVQTALPYGPVYIQTTLAAHPAICAQIVRLFEARFDPQLSEVQRRDQQLLVGQLLDDALDKVASLDADRILRAAVNVVRAGLRSNYFQTLPDGGYKHYVSLKLDPAKVPDLPLPRPMFEIWVYAPEVEGVHLRGGKVARGGLRWSDRRQDFRTEVLGLMKAQMVKNTVIVPVGAKGGFVLKTGNPAEREAWAKLGVEGYKTFLRGLLDLTDNRQGAKVIPPKDVVRYDEDDPYLVVAADKGTATFSDIANGISADYGHWLGDAFASGGSVGYDHKKMGITAKGAWESVKRHFRELGKDIQSEAFTVVGIGDMSGDVFGNGMLLSPHIHLLAAFDHRHIFLDPQPDASASFAERARLFALPRSSWDDYDKTLISKGGGVYPRSAKSIELSEELRQALAIEARRLTPNELMNAILKAPVDLLWNGGIGTYVKAAAQAHPEVGDRANDGLRVNGRELRCKVVGEGGNLGCTQLGRIEAALKGVKLNTDAIDNAGGVHSSDREVNIKIPLNQLMAEGKLDRASRDPLLMAMTEDLARAVLRDSTVQSGAVSLLEAQSAARLDEHRELIRTLEREGLLNRAVEFLPDDEALKERQRQGLGLTRPELSVLLAYAKMSLYTATLASEMPDDPFFVRDLLAYFPPALVERHGEALRKHQLRREIIATILSNAVANRMGLSFAHRLADDHGHARGEVLKAYAVAHEIYEADRYWSAIEALDNRVPAALQTRLMGQASGLLKHATSWLVMAGYARRPVLQAVDRFSAAIREIEALLPQALPPSYHEDWQRTFSQLQAEGVPDVLAARLAATRVLGNAPDITELALEANVTLHEAAAAYFAVGERFRLLSLYAAINGLQVHGKWHALARSNLRDDLYRIHRLLTGRVLRMAGKSAEERLAHWAERHRDKLGFAEARIAELRAAGVSDFEGLVVAVRELRRLRAL
jgi:glutamate dehydrogenase